MLKNRTKIGSAIDTELYNKLKELSEKTRIPISKLNYLIKIYLIYLKNIKVNILLWIHPLS